jgi:hypothetical protein
MHGESVTCFIVWELPTRVDCTWLNEESETTFTTSLKTSAYDRLDLPGAMDIRGLSHMYRYFESDVFFLRLTGLRAEMTHRYEYSFNQALWI